jgi:hypothetical protein
MNATTTFQVNGPNVVHETIDDEVIIVNLNSGTYYSLEKSGAYIWNMVTTEATAGEIAAKLRQQFDANPSEIESAVDQILSELAEEGLIVESDSDGAHQQQTGDSHAIQGTAAFERPLLHRYTDMQDFLLLDPINEVERRGWPDLNQARPV